MRPCLALSAAGQTGYTGIAYVARRGEGRKNAMSLFGHSQSLAAAMPWIREVRPSYWVWIGNEHEGDLAAASDCAALGVKLIVRHNIGTAWTPAAYVASARQQP